MLISINSILDYIVCPFKLSYSTATDSIDPTHKLYKLLIHQCMLYLAKNERMHLTIANTILNNCWSTLKTELPGADSSFYLSVKHRLKQIEQNLFADISELIATDYQTTITLQQHVLDIKIKAVYLNTSRVLTFLFEYPSSGYHFVANSLNNNVLTFVARTIAKQDFNTMSTPQVMVFKSATGMTYKLETDKTLHQLKDVINNLVQGISQKIYYPISNTNNCTNCEYKSNCEWKQ